MSEFVKRVKEMAPVAFEEFRTGWLRQNFPYWNESDSPKIWFCEMDFRMQVVFFQQYLHTLGYRFPINEDLELPKIIIMNVFLDRNDKAK